MMRQRFSCVLLVLALCGCVGRAIGAEGKATVIEAANFPNLQAALDAVPTNGGVVKLPPGEFVITAPLVLTRGDTRIEGAGTATHIVNRNTKGEAALIIRPPNIAKNSRAKIWRVQVDSLRITGNTNSGDGIYCHGVNEFFASGVSVERHGGHGIHLNDCYEDARIADCLITYNRKAGLNINACHDIVVNANQFEENQDAVRCADSFNLTMNGNNVDDHLRHGVVIENTYGSVLSGNMIEECNGIAVILDRDCYGITVSANVIAHHLGGGVFAADAWGCAISANTFTLVHSNSVLVSSNSGRLTISGNNFSNSYIGGGKDKRPATNPNPMSHDAATGIVLQSTSDIVISGNQFSGLSGQAVIGRGKCERISVTGNVVTDWGRGLTKKTAAVDLGGAKGSQVKGNIIAK